MTLCSCKNKDGNLSLEEVRAGTGALLWWAGTASSLRPPEHVRPCGQVAFCALADTLSLTCLTADNRRTVSGPAAARWGQLVRRPQRSPQTAVSRSPSGPRNTGNTHTRSNTGTHTHLVLLIITDGKWKWQSALTSVPPMSSTVRWDVAAVALIQMLCTTLLSTTRHFRVRSRGLHVFTAQLCGMCWSGDMFGINWCVFPFTLCL